MKCHKCKKEFGSTSNHVIFNALDKNNNPTYKDFWYCSERCLMTYYNSGEYEDDEDKEI